MPVEIRELVIKATVVQGNTSVSSNDSTTSNNELSSGEEIINDCLQKMIEIQKDKTER